MVNRGLNRDSVTGALSFKSINQTTCSKEYLGYRMPKHNFGQNLKFEIAGVSLKKKAQDQGNLNLINSFPSPNSVSMQDLHV